MFAVKPQNNVSPSKNNCMFNLNLKMKNIYYHKYDKYYKLNEKMHRKFNSKKKIGNIFIENLY